MNINAVRRVLSAAGPPRAVFIRARRRSPRGKWRLALPAIVILAAACAVVRADNNTVPAAPERPPVFASSVIVKLAEGLSPAEQQAVIARDGGVETSSIPPL